MVVPLLPKFLHTTNCPMCGAPADGNGWSLSGCRPWAIYTCTAGHSFIAELPTGHAYIHRLHFSPATNELVGDLSGFLPSDFARYHRFPDDRPLSMDVSKVKPSLHASAVIINCLDFIYGHSLLKLLNLSRFVKLFPQDDLIVIVPSSLKWLVPPTAAEIWSVDWEWERGKVHNPFLDSCISKIVGDYGEVRLARLDPHPHPLDIDIGLHEIPSFDRATWAKATPQVTIVLRDDRPWGQLRWFESVPGVRRLFWTTGIGRQVQRIRVHRLMRLIRRSVPLTSFSIIGIGRRIRTRPGAKDLRERNFPTPFTEREWLRICSESQVVIGIHGSHMLLPSCAAGSTIDLIPKERLGNIWQDLLVNAADSREALLYYRSLPITSSANTTAAVAVSLLTEMPSMLNRLGVKRSQQSL